MSTAATTVISAESTARPMGWTLLGWVARILVGAVFILAAAGKIEKPETFANEIRAYGLAPFFMTNALSYILPWTELVLGGLLIAGVWRREARLLTTVMLVFFTGIKIYAEMNGLKTGCGCFSGFLADYTKWLNGPAGVALNVVLLGLLALDQLGASKTAPPRRRTAPKA